MHLQKALSLFSRRKPKSLELAATSRLAALCAPYKPRPNSTEQSRLKIKRILAQFENGSEHLLSRRDVRFIASSIGTSDLIGQIEASRVLTELDSRGDNRLFQAVFTGFLSSYQQPSMRQMLRTFLLEHLNALNSRTRAFIEHSGILRSDEALKDFAKSFAASADPSLFCFSHNLTLNVLASSYGTSLKLAAVREVVKADEPIFLRRFLDWIFSGFTGTPPSDFYEAMLSPFKEASPQPEIQTALLSFIVSKYGDPRINVWPHLSGRGADERRAVCVSTLSRWLSIEYLDLFIRIIEKTAKDKQFRPRKEFWLKYFESNFISNLTLLLAADADQIARKMRNQNEKTEYMKWSKLRNSLPNQSVLLMQLGDFVIAEWSHDGAMRFWKTGDGAPKFNRAEYTAGQLRAPGLRVRTGGGMKESIRHDDQGNWMRWASSAIKQHTGISI